MLVVQSLLFSLIKNNHFKNHLPIYLIILLNLFIASRSRILPISIRRKILNINSHHHSRHLSHLKTFTLPPKKTSPSSLKLIKHNRLRKCSLLPPYSLHHTPRSSHYRKSSYFRSRSFRIGLRIRQNRSSFLALDELVSLYRFNRFH